MVSIHVHEQFLDLRASRICFAGVESAVDTRNLYRGVVCRFLDTTIRLSVLHPARLHDFMCRYSSFLNAVYGSWKEQTWAEEPTAIACADTYASV